MGAVKVVLLPFVEEREPPPVTHHLAGPHESSQQFTCSPMAIVVRFVSDGVVAAVLWRIFVGPTEPVAKPNSEPAVACTEALGAGVVNTIWAV